MLLVECPGTCMMGRRCLPDAPRSEAARCGAVRRGAACVLWIEDWSLGLWHLRGVVQLDRIRRDRIPANDLLPLGLRHHGMEFAVGMPHAQPLRHRVDVVRGVDRGPGPPISGAILRRDQVLGLFWRYGRAVFNGTRPAEWLRDWR